MRCKKYVHTILFVISFLHINAQSIYENKLLKPADTLNKKRVLCVSAVQAGIWAGSLIALNKAWYAQYPRSSFHFFDDSGEWLQVDKTGHAFSAYWGANFSASLFRWSGIKRKKAALYGAGMGIAFESVIEILDGYSKEWGFSVSDMIANTTGSLLFLSQELAWEQQRIQFKFSAHRITYKDPTLEHRADNLYGKSLPERILKDYNAQTYWLSANLHSFAPDAGIPKWLNIAIGYGAANMYGGYENIWKDNKQNTENYTHIPRIRQWYLSPDIDISKIKIKGKVPKLFQVLSVLRLKFPLPTMEINTYGDVKFHPLFF